MRGVNKVTILGNVGQDPEYKALQNGGVVSLSVATTESWTGKDGTRQEKTEWHRCTAFGKLADIIRDYVHKGSKVYLEGKLQTRSWDQDGQKRYATEIVLSELQMLDSKPQEQASQPASNPTKQHRAAVQQPIEDDFSDDIPF
jgi:single-strand DNA-binding protein